MTVDDKMTVCEGDPLFLGASGVARRENKKEAK